MKNFVFLRFHRFLFIFSLILGSFLFSQVTTATRAEAAIVTTIVDVSAQRMNVYVNRELWFSWPVSSGYGRYHTPRGVYRPTRLHRTWFSRKYYNAPMPYSIFFHRGYAIHGTYHINRLGRPASRGCIRLHVNHAAELFRLVKFYGPRNTKIIIRN